MGLEVIHNIAEICAQKDVKDFFLSPGSRCAPLTIALVRHPSINTKTIADERSAAFIALGTALQTRKTTGLLCTSGSASYNYAPAIAEAFYQQIPLLVLTADRPPEWIDQNDGQTIRQNFIYGNHVKKSYNLPVDLEHADSKWHVTRILSEAINLTQQYPQGPVHVNIPLREPFYPEKEIVFDSKIKIIQSLSGAPSLSSSEIESLKTEIKNYKKVLIVGGQQSYNKELINQLSTYSQLQNIPVIGDAISNLNGKDFIHYHDTILSSGNAKLADELSPDLLITFGNSLISKNLKTFLRKHKPSAHWHIQPAGETADTFQSLTKVIQVYPEYFFAATNATDTKKDNAYLLQWMSYEKVAKNYVENYFNTEKTFMEFFAVNESLKSLPQNSLLHVANSMTVRYVNYIGIDDSKEIEVFANRGTSGIDGTISTAFGAALSTDKIVTVITGDMAFFYDRNAWWNNYKPANLRIIILNNHGGGIFRIIDGPSRQPELDEYFETRQTLLAANTAKDYNLEYHYCNAEQELQKILKTFFNKSDKSKILEVETNSIINTEAFKNFKKNILSKI